MSGYEHLRREYTLTVDVQRSTSGAISVTSVIGFSAMPDDALKAVANMAQTELASREEEGEQVIFQPHERWEDIDWDDYGNIRGYTATPCYCQEPWRHRP